jgi:hypothetical protein
MAVPAEGFLTTRLEQQEMMKEMYDTPLLVEGTGYGLWSWHRFSLDWGAW